MRHCFGYNLCHKLYDMNYPWKNLFRGKKQVHAFSRYRQLCPYITYGRVRHTREYRYTDSAINNVADVVMNDFNTQNTACVSQN